MQSAGAVIPRPGARALPRAPDRSDQAPGEFARRAGILESDDHYRSPGATPTPGSVATLGLFFCWSTTGCLIARKPASTIGHVGVGLRGLIAGGRGPNGTRRAPGIGRGRGSCEPSQGMLRAHETLPVGCDE